MGIKNNKQYFECYYKVNKYSNNTRKKKYNLDKIIEEIKKDESSEFIENLEDLELTFPEILINVTSDDKQEILKKLLE